MPPCAMRPLRLVTAATLAVALVACGGTRVTKEQADVVCTDLTASAILRINGVQNAHSDLQKQFGLSAPAAADVMRQAVNDYCPEFKRLM